MSDSRFTLLNALLPVTESVDGRQATEAERFIDFEKISDLKLSTKLTELPPVNGETVIGFPCEIELYGATADDVELSLVVKAMLSCSVNYEDTTFSAPYGSTTAHGGGKWWDLYDLSFSNAEVPREARNYELFKMPPEQVRSIVDYTINHVESIGEDEISNHVDLEKLGEVVGRHFSSGYDD